MKKWFQMYIDDGDSSEESVAMRINPDLIQGFKKWSTYKTEVYMTIGTFKVTEAYEDFSKRLFAFVNFEEFEKQQKAAEPAEVTTVTTEARKRVIRVVKKQQQNAETLQALQDYYDTHQPMSSDQGKL